MTMETIIFLLNHMLTYYITVDLGKIVLKCKNRVRIEQLFDRKSLLSSQYMYSEKQPELPIDDKSLIKKNSPRVHFCQLNSTQLNVDFRFHTVSYVYRYK